MPRITVDGKLAEITDCPHCGRTVLVENIAGTGWIAQCGRRLLNAAEFLPEGCNGPGKGDTADAQYLFSGSQLADYVGKCNDAWQTMREGELDRMQASLDDMTDRCRTAERRGWEAAEKHYRPEPQAEPQ